MLGDEGVPVPQPPPILRPGIGLQLTLTSHSSSGGGSPKDQSTFQKLLHINATAQLEHPEYMGPLLPPASTWAPRLPAHDGKVTPLQKELQGTLRGLLGSDSRGSFLVATQYGWVLGKSPLPPLTSWRPWGSFHLGQGL